MKSARFPLGYPAARHGNRPRSASARHGCGGPHPVGTARQAFYRRTFGGRRRSDINRGTRPFSQNGQPRQVTARPPVARSWATDSSASATASATASHGPDRNRSDHATSRSCSGVNRSGGADANIRSPATGAAAPERQWRGCRASRCGANLLRIAVAGARDTNSAKPSALPHPACLSTIHARLKQLATCNPL